MREELCERLGTDSPEADPRVPVLERADRVRRVVGVNELQPTRARDLEHLVEQCGHAPRRRDVVPGGEGVAGVEAEADPWMVLEHCEVGPEVRGERAERLPLACGRLEQQ